MPRVSLGSLRFRLILLVLLAVVPALGLTLYSGFEQRQLAAANAHEEALRLNRFALADQKALIDNARQLLATAAQLPVVRETEANACDTLLAGLGERHRSYTGFIVAAPDGQVVCTGIGFQEPVNLADRPWFQRAIETQSFTVGEYVIARGSGKPILPLAYPILSEGDDVEAVVATGLDLTRLSLFVSALELPSGSTLTLIDRDGTVLARHPDSGDWLGQAMPETPIVRTVLESDGEGTAQAKGVDGESRLFAFMPLQGTSENGSAEDGDLYLVAGIPASAAFAEVNGIFVRHLIGLGLVAALALAAAWVIGNVALVRPLKALIRANQQLASGDFSVRLGPPYSVGELGLLAETFDFCAEALETQDTERRQFEEALRRSEARYRLLVDAVEDYAIFMLDPDGHVRTWNEGAERIKGYQPSEIIGEHFSRFYPDEAVEAGRPAHALEIAEEQGRFEDEGWRVRKDGTRFWAMIVITALRDEDEGLRGFSKVVRDITERKRAEDKLRESERRLAEAQRVAHVGSWEWDPQANTLTWSDELYRIYGLRPQEVELSYRDFLERVHPDDRKRVGATVQQAYQDHQPLDFEHRIVRPDGEVRVLHARGKVIVDEAGEPVRMLGTGQDITERKQMEEALRESEQRFRAIFNSTFQFIGLLEPDGTMIEVNRTALDFAGLTRADVVGKPFWEGYWWTISPQTQTELREAIAQAAEGEFVRYTVDVLGANEREATIDFSIKPMQDDEGRVVLLIPEGRNITALKRMEEELRKLSRAVHYSSAAIFIYNAQGKIEYVNPRFSELTGYGASEILGEPVSSLGENTVEVNERIWRAISAGRRWQGEILNRKQSGEPYWALASIAPIKDREGDITHFVEIHDDITERKQMEAELAEMQHRLAEAREAERLHLARELHDGPVQDLHALDLRLSSGEESFDSQAGPAVAEVQDTVEDVARTLRVICGELRPPALAPFGLSVAVRSHAETFMQEHPELEIGLDLTSDGQALPEEMRLALFRVYQQALDNVVQHAEASHVLVRFQMDDEQVRLAIEDDGRGFEVPHRWIYLARRGHLGLLGAVERAEAIGGRLDVESAPGQGTVVRVIAPRPENEEMEE